MRRSVVVFALILLSLAVFRCGGEEEPEPPTELHLVLTFKDANGLRPGQFVIYKGVRIGEVTAVDLQDSLVRVNIVVNEKYRDQIYQEATFTIEKLSAINPTGEHQVLMSDKGNVRTPVMEGSVLVGTEGWFAQVAGALKDAATSAADAGARMTGGGTTATAQTETASSTNSR